MVSPKLIVFAFLFTCYVSSLFSQTTPPPSAEEDMTTQWSEKALGKTILPEYPRPQMVRESWSNLNGEWDYTISSIAEGKPHLFDGKINVPFAVESSLSEVQQSVDANQYLWYRKNFKKSYTSSEGRLLLHFGAVDWHATVFIDGDSVGEHRGGYDSFTIDITEQTRKGKNHQLMLRVWDPTDSDHQARGKQVRNPKGIWYTAVTGIWQTVWLEAVPKTYITDIKLTPDVDNDLVHLTIHFNEAPGACTIITEIEANTPPAFSARRKVFLEAPVFEADLPVHDTRLWSPERPFLYGLNIQVKQNSEIMDEVSSYFGMRKISLEKDERGYTRIFLNNEPYFQLGPLDQGWWPDGLYTAPTDEALKYDIEALKDMGFNMLRKHVKVEPDRFYYHCDQIGMLVWQDMPSGFSGYDLQVRPEDANDAIRPEESAIQFEQEYKAMIDQLYNHPSIVVWVPFNEGWGQYDVQRINEWTKSYDPSRLSNPTSGWTDRKVGDIYDAHIYPGPGMEMVEETRASVLGEFGGLGLPIAGHLWGHKDNWGYQTYSSQQALIEGYENLMKGLEGLLSMGLSAAIYTQTTDVEGEVNGLMTYDRELLKFDPEKMKEIAGNLYAFEGQANQWLPSSEHQPQLWEYTQEAPGTDWITRGSSTRNWISGNGPFSSGDQLALPDGTDWMEGDMWIRQTFVLDSLPPNLRAQVYVASGVTAEVYLNSRLLTTIEDSRGGRHYTHLDLSEQANLLRTGDNLISVKLTAEKEKRGFDIGLYSIE